MNLIEVIRKSREENSEIEFRITGKLALIHRNYDNEINYLHLDNPDFIINQPLVRLKNHFGNTLISEDISNSSTATNRLIKVNNDIIIDAQLHIQIDGKPMTLTRDHGFLFLKTTKPIKINTNEG